MKSFIRNEILLLTLLNFLPQVLVAGLPHAALSPVTNQITNDVTTRSLVESQYIEPGATLTSLDLYDAIELLADSSDVTYLDSSKDQAHVSELPTAIKTSDIRIQNFSAANSTADTEDAPKFKSTEYDGKHLGTGAILDEFVTGKLSTADHSNTLPLFLTEPENVYVVKNRPAVLKCKVAHALQIHFKCSGSSQPPPSTHDKHVDPHTGVHLEEVTATIHRDLVDEYFGKGPFKCECQAWSSRGVVKSQAATVNIAYIRKQFVVSPSSLRVEIGSRIDLHCEPPHGYPEPQITWHKNNVPITVNSEHGPITSSIGSLTFQQVALQDMANYTCSAENMAGKRISDSAVLIVYVNGGWSSWSPWRECKCSGNQSQGRKRTRTCSNPMPMNGGSLCIGSQIQKSPDCTSCVEDTQIIMTDELDVLSNKRLGRWSPWSEWSSCSFECIQIRRRKCISNEEGGSVTNIPGANIGMSSKIGNRANSAVSSKLQCIGREIQTAECRGDNCHLGKDDFDWTLYLGLAFITTVCFAFGAALICCARRNMGANTHYNITRTVMDSKYMQGVDKKEMQMQIEAANISYDYASAAHRYQSDDPSYAISEHHYDVPNLSANYTNPIDDLSVDYFTDTPDSSSADTSNSTYDINAKSSMLLSQTCEPVTSKGGSLRLYGDQLVLYIPELALGKSQKKHVSLILLSDDNTRISGLDCAEPLLICSTIVHCAPRNFSFLKPVILKVPHCLTDPELWNVNIYHADNDPDDFSVTWRKLIAVGKETINTPVFVQLDPAHVYIMTEILGRFVVVAELKPASTEIRLPSIKMKLIAFSQLTPGSASYSLRVYVVKNFPNSTDICSRIESQLGGSYMGESKAFAFLLSNCNLTIRVRINDQSGDLLLADAQQDEIHEHIIPYNHILSNNSILHCEFSIKRSCQQSTGVNLALGIDFGQCDPASNTFELHSFSISESEHVLDGAASSDQTTIEPRVGATISVDRHGNYVNDRNLSVTSSSSVQLPRVTKRMICTALDPPRADERDWRLLAKKLNTDRYIAYFATKPSPTEQILNLWECRAADYSTHTIVKLIMILKEMDRQDVIDIITETIGPLWI